MASPVQQALLGARMQEEPTAFGRWCVVRGIRSLPAAPAHVAAFLVEVSEMKPVKMIWPLVQEISRTHLANGLADPTAGGVVSEMINSISHLDPPRSWPKEQKARFASLPYDLQLFIVGHENLRDKAIGRAQNEAAILRQGIAAVQKPEEANNGTEIAAA